MRDDTKETFLKRNGFQNLVSTHDAQKNTQKLVLGRIDLRAAKKPGFKTICDLAKIDYQAIEEVYSIRELNVSIAISKKTSNSIVKKMEYVIGR